jgi:hypothetical protein
LRPRKNALAAIHVQYDWDWATAESVCRRGVELRPSDVDARQHLADYMSIQSRHDEAIAEGRKALESNPISRRSLGIWDCFCTGHAAMTSRSHNAKRP